MPAHYHPNQQRRIQPRVLPVPQRRRIAASRRFLTLEMNMDLNCPKCNSENTQSLATAYEAGMSHTSSSTKGVGIGLGAGGVAVGVGGASTAGVAQTLTSQRASPPQKKAYFKPLMGILVVGLIIMVIGGMIWQPLALLGQFFWIVGSGIYAYRAYQFNSTTWPGLFEDWKHTFICHRCSHAFRIQ